MSAPTAPFAAAEYRTSEQGENYALLLAELNSTDQRTAADALLQRRPDKSLSWAIRTANRLRRMDPEQLASTLTYRDPVGEHAVNRVVGGGCR